MVGQMFMEINSICYFNSFVFYFSFSESFIIKQNSFLTDLNNLFMCRHATFGFGWSAGVLIYL